MLEAILLMKRQKLINHKVSLSRKFNPRDISKCEFLRNLLKIAVAVSLRVENAQLELIYFFSFV